MAMHDWNHNGKNDLFDNFVDYSIYNETMNEDKKLSSSSGNSSSGSGILAAVIGFFLVAVFFTMLGADVGDMPGILTLFMWGFFGFVVKLIMDSM